jgi:hypothetical protein
LLITDGEDGEKHYHREWRGESVSDLTTTRYLVPFVENIVLEGLRFVKYWLIEMEIIMVKRTNTVIRKFVFKDTETPQAREEMVKELRALLEQLRAEDSELQFKKLTIRYTDGAVDEYEACNEPCLIMQELAE